MEYLFYKKDTNPINRILILIAMKVKIILRPTARISVSRYIGLNALLWSRRNFL